eukprot:g17507.t1
MAMQAWPVSAVAGLGALDTAYLTYAKINQVPLACPSSGSCTEVLNSSFASIGPVPLSLLGLLAYLSVVALSFASQGSKDLRELMWWLCLTMALTSLGLTAILIFILQAPCLYCAASAFITAMLLALVETKRARDEAKERNEVRNDPSLLAAEEGEHAAPVDSTPETPVMETSETHEPEPRRVVLGLSGVLALGSLRAGTLPSREFASAWAYFNLVEQYKPNHPPVRSPSSKAELALARYLQKIGAACYTAWWCPHCQEQRESFGKEAVEVAPFVECSSINRRQLQVCRDQDIENYPTWIINGEKFLGGRDLSELVEMSGFKEYPPEAFKPREPSEQTLLALMIHHAVTGTSSRSVVPAHAVPHVADRCQAKLGPVKPRRLVCAGAVLAPGFARAHVRRRKILAAAGEVNGQRSGLAKFREMQIMQGNAPPVIIFPAEDLLLPGRTKRMHLFEPRWVSLVDFSLNDCGGIFGMLYFEESDLLPVISLVEILTCNNLESQGRVVEVRAVSRAQLKGLTEQVAMREDWGLALVEEIPEVFQEDLTVASTLAGELSSLCENLDVSIKPKDCPYRNLLQIVCRDLFLSDAYLALDNICAPGPGGVPVCTALPLPTTDVAKANLQEAKDSLAVLYASLSQASFALRREMFVSSASLEKRLKVVTEKISELQGMARARRALAGERPAKRPRLADSVTAASAGSCEWAQVISAVQPAIVTFVVSFEDEQAAVALGTGFVVDKERGLILTNRHITGVGPVRALAIFDRHEELEVEVVYRDPIHDFGFFKYDVTKLRFTETAEIALNCEDLCVGTEIRVVGNDAGEKLQILSGTIARVDRNVPEFNTVYNDENTFYAGAGAGTSGGSSGSPVLNKSGHAIALNAAGTDGAASAFFLPLDRVCYTLKSLREGLPVQRGTCQASFLFKAFDELMKVGLLESHEHRVRDKKKAATGMLLVDAVLCEQKKLRPGDILLSIEGQICIDFVYLESILDSKVGSSVEDRMLTLNLETADSRYMRNMWTETHQFIGVRSYIELGLDVVHSLGYHAARKTHLPLDSGVYLARPGYVFESLGCDWGSLITTVNGKATPSPEAFVKAIEDIPDRQYFTVHWYDLRDFRLSDA